MRKFFEGNRLRSAGLLVDAARVTAWAGLIVGCSQAPDDDASQVSRQELQETSSKLAAAVEARLGALNDHEGLVEGVVEVRGPSGVSLGARAVSKMTPPPNLGELMETGELDAEGYGYTDVSGAAGDGELETRYRYVKRYKPESSNKPKAQPRVPVVQEGVTASARFKAQLKEPDVTGEVNIIIALKTSFSTKVRPATARGLASLYGAEEEYLTRRASISARKAEADALQADTKAALLSLGASNVGGFWSSNGLTAKVPKSKLAQVLRIPNIRTVDLDPELPTESTTQWDGADEKAPGGLNAGIYHDAGYHGQAYADLGGRMMRIGMIQSDGWLEHPGFNDTATSGTRTVVYDCSSSPCVANQSNAAGVGAHDLKCAGLAAGSLRQHQVSGYTSQQELERSGVAEEPEVYFLEGTSVGSATRAIDLAVDLELDFLSGSRGTAGACDGNASSAFEAAVMNAQLANIITVLSAGNEGNSGGCSITDPKDTPSVFVVGGLGSSGNTCTSSNYSTCPMGSFSSRGGYDATVNGSTSAGAISGVAVTVPACPIYYLGEQHTSPTAPDEEWIRVDSTPACGTSYAAPQVAGAGILVKDYFLANNFNTISTEGRPYVVLLAMGDRQSESGAKLSAGFDNEWGAGRFQMRRFDSSDHTGVWGWETYSHMFTAEGATNHNLFGSGTESTSLNQAKVYAMFFEQDADDIAKIDLRVRADNCSGASLGLDSSDDVKKMVRVGSEGAGQALCARLNALHLPAGESRRMHVFAYYSGDTAMR
jgi:hypothetical protein